jgi:PAS domain S-box-containing protein
VTSPLSRPGPRTSKLLLTAAVAALLAGAVVAAFIDSRGTRVAFAIPLAVVLAVAAWVGIERSFRARRAQRLAESRLDGARSDGEAKFRALAESSPSVTLLRDADDGSVLYVSPQVEALLGYTVAEWKADSRLFVSALHPDDRERVLAELDAAPTDGRPFRSSYRLVARDGHVVGVREATTTVRNATGEPLYTQSVLLDDSERRRADEERDRLRRAERDTVTHKVVLQGRLDLLRDASEVLAASVDTRSSV